MSTVVSSISGFLQHAAGTLLILPLPMLVQAFTRVKMIATFVEQNQGISDDKRVRACYFCAREPDHEAVQAISPLARASRAKVTIDITVLLLRSECQRCID